MPKFSDRVRAERDKMDPGGDIRTCLNPNILCGCALADEVLVIHRWFESPSLFCIGRVDGPCCCTGYARLMETDWYQGHELPGLQAGGKFLLYRTESFCSSPMKAVVAIARD